MGYNPYPKVSIIWSLLCVVHLFCSKKQLHRWRSTLKTVRNPSFARRLQTFLSKNMNNMNRDWMYERLDGRGGINSIVITGVNNTIQYAFSQRNCMNGDTLNVHALTELSLFFNVLTSTTLRVDDFERLEADIPQILCKLERIFSPGFFDSIEHMSVHFPYEARIVVPVQYRWIYPFERYLGSLKRIVGNKASVEGSICDAYLMTESSQLFSHYLESHVMTRNHNMDRNDDGGVMRDLEGNLSIFTHPGRLGGEAKKEIYP